MVVKLKLSSTSLFLNAFISGSKLTHNFDSVVTLLYTTANKKSMPKVIVLSHHQVVVESLLRTEGWRIKDGFEPRTSQAIASDWYKGQGSKGSRQYKESYTDPDRDKGLMSAMASAIDASIKGELETVSDFGQKRDEICEACPVSANDCWRRNENFTVRDGIDLLRGRRI